MSFMLQAAVYTYTTQNIWFFDSSCGEQLRVEGFYAPIELVRTWNNLEAEV